MPNLMRFELDHLVVAADSLEAGRTFVRDSLGVQMQAGGRHERMGTHNALLRLDSGQYLEVIAIDPSIAPPNRARWFGLDSFSGEPRLVHWVARVARVAWVTSGDLERLRLPEHGPVLTMTRGEFAWRITVPDDGGLPGNGLVPTLIQWDSGPRIVGPSVGPSAVNFGRTGPSHPSDFLPNQNCALIGLEGTHPNPEPILERLSTLGVISVTAGPVSLRARVQVDGEIRFLGSGDQDH
jgi:Glyoxalase-like domain